jgi:hypothetical protein
MAPDRSLRNLPRESRNLRQRESEPGRVTGRWASVERIAGKPDSGHCARPRRIA